MELVNLNKTIEGQLNIDEKTSFEMYVIQSFKSLDPKETKEDLEKALLELASIKLELNDQREILNNNIIDKLNRISERNYLHLNILIAKIYDCLVSKELWNNLSKKTDNLIKFANNFMKLMDKINSSLLSKQLEMKFSLFLNFLNQLEELTDFQKESINELINSIPNKESSEVYRNFDSKMIPILKLISNKNIEDCSQGINLLIEAFSFTSSLDEQIDLFIKHVPKINDVLFETINEEMCAVYFQYASFFLSIIFSTKFKIDALIQNYSVQSEKLSHNFLFFFKEDELLETYNNELSFLHDTYYELTTQKEAIVNVMQIASITLKLIENIYKFERNYNILFVCFLLLKRIYFTFPFYRSNLTDYLTSVLIAIYSIRNQFKDELIDECNEFLKYLLTSDEVKSPLKESLLKKFQELKISFEGESIRTLESTELESESLLFGDFNLKVGWTNSLKVENGCIQEKLIDVHHSNSIIYIGFANQTHDISFEIMKYNIEDLSLRNTDNNQEDNNHNCFESIMRLEYIDASEKPAKIIMFVASPGTYKLVWDNKYSYFTSKNIRYRCSVLKPFSNVDPNKIVDVYQVKKESINLNKKENLVNFSMKIIYEGNERIIDLTHIKQKERTIIENRFFYSTIPILINKEKLRVLNYNDMSKVDLEIDLKNKNLVSVLENEIIQYIENIENYRNRVLFLNFFLVEKLEIKKSDILIKINNESDPNEDNFIQKLGFYPEKIKKQIKNIHLFVGSLADCCLIYNLYEQTINQLALSNFLIVHFDKFNVQLSMNLEGLINNKINGLNYDSILNLGNKQEKAITIISNITTLFESLEIYVSFSNFTNDEADLIFINISNGVNENSKKKIQIKRKNDDFVKNVLSFSQFFKSVTK